MHNVLKKSVASFCLSGPQVVRSFPPAITGGGVTYSKSDFYLKLLCNSDDLGEGELPRDLSKFMNGPKDSAQAAKAFLLELQQRGLIWLRVDGLGNFLAYKILYF